MKFKENADVVEEIRSLSRAKVMDRDQKANQVEDHRRSVARSTLRNHMEESDAKRERTRTLGRKVRKELLGENETVGDRQSHGLSDQMGRNRIQESFQRKPFQQAKTKVMEAARRKQSRDRQLDREVHVHDRGKKFLATLLEKNQQFSFADHARPLVLDQAQDLHVAEVAAPPDHVSS